MFGNMGVLNIYFVNVNMTLQLHCECAEGIVFQHTLSASHTVNSETSSRLQLCTWVDRLIITKVQITF